MGHSAQQLIERYKYVDGEYFGERKHWLQDDYVKFIDFAQQKMEGSAEGIVGIISNHSWIDNPTFRGLRKSLLNTFQRIYVIDLHGSAKKQERAPDGSRDENVFDIQQGVAITLLIKRKDLPSNVESANVFGLRLTKYAYLAKTTLLEMDWINVKPQPPSYVFVRQKNRELWHDYSSFYPLQKIMPINGVGIVTARDNLTIHFTEDSLRNTVTEFVSMGIQEARIQFELGADAQSWRVERAQNDVKEHGVRDELLVRIYYRPFDLRWTYYSGKSSGFLARPVNKVMKHLIGVSNIGLTVTRQVKTGNV